MADFLKMDDALSHLDLKSTMMAAEFGCGSAHFTMLLARTLKQGRVYALDIQESKLSALQGRLKQQSIKNVFTVLCDLEANQGSQLESNTLDVVLIPNTLFQAEDKHAIIKEAHRVLKDGGQLLVIEWLKEHSFSPQEVVKPETVKEIANKLGLSLKEEFGSGDYHYGLVFTK